jgi:hypothetical protein
MRGKRAKQIFKLVRNKHPEVLKSIIERVGKKEFEKMGGVAIYRMAKRLWSQGITGKEKWLCSK